MRFHYGEITCIAVNGSYIIGRCTICTSLFRPTKKTPKLWLTGLSGFPSQVVQYCESVPRHDVITPIYRMCMLNWSRGCYTANFHYNDVIMSAMASQITDVCIVCPTVGSGTDQRKHQSSGSQAFVRGIHRWPVNSPHKRPVTRKMFPFDDVIMLLSAVSLIQPLPVHATTMFSWRHHSIAAVTYTKFWWGSSCLTLFDCRFPKLKCS